ncbi:hypothetical protein JZ751_020519 [Albula glossodonta]|uniref:Uncharacterized protein n=1 Tax=Albula glossodonta TaxID=121402 RepID=A0A8T2PJY2_9TELE|nr:hypothetical protein JZ751_020519 [Albula glossodonta]
MKKPMRQRKQLCPDVHTPKVKGTVCFIIDLNQKWQSLLTALHSSGSLFPDRGCSLLSLSASVYLSSTRDSRGSPRVEGSALPAPTSTFSASLICIRSLWNCVSNNVEGSPRTHFGQRCRVIYEKKNQEGIARGERTPEASKAEQKPRRGSFPDGMKKQASPTVARCRVTRFRF